MVKLNEDKIKWLIRWKEQGNYFESIHEKNFGKRHTGHNVECLILLGKKGINNLHWLANRASNDIL